MKALTQKKDMLSELAFSGRHADQSVWVLTQKYNAVLKDLREQTRWVCFFHCKDRDSFEDCLWENDVIPTREQRSLVRQQLAEKHAKLLLKKKKKVREKSRECHNHKPQPFSDPKRKRKPTNLNKHKPNKRTKSTKISSLFPKRDNRNTKRTEKHRNKMAHRKTYNKSPRRINNKATKSKTNTGTTALERSVEQTTGGRLISRLLIWCSHA